MRLFLKTDPERRAFPKRRVPRNWRFQKLNFPETGPGTKSRILPKARIRLKTRILPNARL